MPAPSGTGSAAESFSAQVLVEEDRVRLLLEGELDIAALAVAEPALEEALRDARSALVVDLSGLTFIDSSGLQFVVGSKRRCDEAGLDLSLVPGDRNVQRIFALTGLDGALPFEQPE